MQKIRPLKMLRFLHNLSLEAKERLDELKKIFLHYLNLNTKNGQTKKTKNLIMNFTLREIKKWIFLI